MSLWSIVSQMAPEEFGGIFTEFPRSLRCVLGEWLENQPWEFIHGPDAFCSSVAQGLLSAMLERLRSAGGDGQQCHILQQISSIEISPCALLLPRSSVCGGCPPLPPPPRPG
ncbi:signal transducer and transcription activator 6-like isoform X2 [Numida meleagris]|nr:signal transducer and transcription activator 6-like isoform X2 [Numida meleagris]